MIWQQAIQHLQWLDRLRALGDAWTYTVDNNDGGQALLPDLAGVHAVWVAKQDGWSVR